MIIDPANFPAAARREREQLSETRRLYDQGVKQYEEAHPELYQTREQRAVAVKQKETDDLLDRIRAEQDAQLTDPNIPDNAKRAILLSRAKPEAREAFLNAEAEEHRIRIHRELVETFSPIARERKAVEEHQQAVSALDTLQHQFEAARARKADALKALAGSPQPPTAA